MLNKALDSHFSVFLATSLILPYLNRFVNTFFSNQIRIFNIYNLTFNIQSTNFVCTLNVCTLKAAQRNAFGQALDLLVPVS